jgi:translation initiation factor 2 subunit 1
MSLLRNEEWPEVGELVVASVSKITHYGVYVMLDEYEKEGFLHISEISSSWVKNIRDFVHEGEKVVLKVLRVDPERKHVDLSLRRVAKRERRERILVWKQGKKAESLLRSAAQRLGMPLDEIHEKAWNSLEEAFGGVYEGLERAAREGAEVLLEQGLPKELAEVLTEIAKEKIRMSTVKVKGTLKISCPKPDGVLQIKDALLKAKDVKVPRGTKVRIYVVSPPKYQIEVMASNYKQANAIIEKATEKAVDSIAKAGGQAAFERG